MYQFEQLRHWYLHFRFKPDTNHPISAIYVDIRLKWRYYSTSNVYPIVAKQSGEVGGLQTVQDVDELGTVDGVHGGEDTAWEQTQLQQLSDGLILGRLGTARQEPPVLLLHNT